MDRDLKRKVPFSLPLQNGSARYRRLRSLRVLLPPAPLFGTGLRWHGSAATQSPKSQKPMLIQPNTIICHRLNFQPLQHGTTFLQSIRRALVSNHRISTLDDSLLFRVRQIRRLGNQVSAARKVSPWSQQPPTSRAKAIALDACRARTSLRFIK